MLFRWRVEAMGIIASEVMKPKGLIGFGLDMVDHSGPEIATAWDPRTLLSHIPLT